MGCCEVNVNSKTATSTIAFTSPDFNDLLKIIRVLIELILAKKQASGKVYRQSWAGSSLGECEGFTYVNKNSYSINIRGPPREQKNANWRSFEGLSRSTRNSVAPVRDGNPCSLKPSSPARSPVPPVFLVQT